MQVTFMPQSNVKFLLDVFVFLRILNVYSADAFKIKWIDQTCGMRAVQFNSAPKACIYGTAGMFQSLTKITIAWFVWSLRVLG